MQLPFVLLSCLVMAMLVSSMPYNGVGPFYNGDVASDPLFDIRVGGATFSQGLQSCILVFRSICGQALLLSVSHWEGSEGIDLQNS